MSDAVEGHEGISHYGRVGEVEIGVDDVVGVEEETVLADEDLDGSEQRESMYTSLFMNHVSFPAMASSSSSLMKGLSSPSYPDHSNSKWLASISHSFSA